jgi:apolipoprotein N-acyltransferase
MPTLKPEEPIYKTQPTLFSPRRKATFMKLLKPLRLDFRKASLACLSGALLFLSFPPASLFPLSFIAFLPLLWALEGSSPRRAFLLGWASGAFYFVLLLHWIVLNPAVEAWVKPLLYLGVVLIGFFQGLFWAVPAALSRWLSDKSGLPIWVSFPALFTVFDWLRGLGLLGFTWGSPGYALARWTDALQMASVGGLWLVTLWTVLISGLVFWAAHPFLGRPPQVASGRMRALLPRLLALVAAVFIPPLAGIPVKRAVESLEAPAPVFTVALVQGNIDQGMRWDREFQEYNWTEYRRLTQEAAAHKPDLVVWPETAMPFYLRYENRFFSEMLSLVDGAGFPVLTGVPDAKTDFETGRTDYYNSAFLFLPGRGLAGEYAKAHLVPFGERFPLKDRIPGLRHVNFGEGEWTPGADTVMLHHPLSTISCLVCFESIFPAIARRQAAKGSRLFVNITNDGWFGRSGAARQHAEMAVFRAVEQRRSVARCANSGVSMFVTPSGRVHQATPLYVRAVIVRSLPLLDCRTLYGRFGDWVVLLLLACLAPFFVLALARRPK